MATYLIAREITITRQSGDVADIAVRVPDLLPMEGRSARFQVFDSSGRLLIDKDETILQEGQVITIPLLPQDTQGLSGRFQWELEVRDGSGPVTIGRGPFGIVKTLIR